jgi:hypothetical protein
MPTVENPAANAEDADRALRALADATRSIPAPEDSYTILGALSSGLAAVEQSLDQLVTWHERTSSRAVDKTGDREAGGIYARAAAAELRETIDLIHRSNTRLGVAWGLNGRITWQPQPQPQPQHPASERANKLAPVVRVGALPARSAGGLGL